MSFIISKGFWGTTTPNALQQWNSTCSVRKNREREDIFGCKRKHLADYVKKKKYFCCTDTFSKWWKITRGMKMSAQ
jgi:hypothetical protein